MQKLLGHKYSRLTSNLYSFLCGEGKRDAMRSLDEMMAGRAEQKEHG